MVCGVLVEAAFGEEAPAHLRGGAPQLLAEVLLGDRMGVDQAPAGTEVGAVTLATGGVLVVQLDAVAPGEHLDRLDEAEVADLLHEGDDVPTLTAAEAMPVAQLRADVERRGLLVVEGAQTLHRADPGGAQGHVLGDHLVQPRALAHQVHVGAADQTLGHRLRAPIRGRAAGCLRR